MDKQSETKQAICVMAKPPRGGNVKTRLGDHCDSETREKLAEAFLLDTWQSASSLSSAALVLSICGASSDLPKGLQSVHLHQQAGDTLGDKIDSALLYGLSIADTCCVIGSDLPGLPAKYIESAFDNLEVADVVLGPSTDGGFYLIGASRWQQGLLSGVFWSSSSTLRQTISSLTTQGKRVTQVPTYDDIDRWEDVVALGAGSIAHDPYPHTKALLREIL